MSCIRNCRSFSNEEYGAVVKHTPNQFRKIFAILIPLQLTVVPLIRIPYRICTLISGDFIRVGYRKAEKVWELEKQKWSVNEQNRVFKAIPQSPLPSKHRFYADIVKYSSWEFVKNITKIAAYPLAIVANLFICIYGLIDPINAYPLYAKIEYALSRDVANLFVNRPESK